MWTTAMTGFTPFDVTTSAQLVAAIASPAQRIAVSTSAYHGAKGKKSIPHDFDRVYHQRQLPRRAKGCDMTCFSFVLATLLFKHLKQRNIRP
eukprot:4882136-Pyramimonas_sp.AAC.2